MTSNSAKHLIMIVDDAPDNLLLLEMMLESSYDLIKANSGQECLDLIEQSIPDILLLDINMPLMTGYEVCLNLRKKAATRCLPIIFVSAMISTTERLAGFESGGDDYITKPVDEKVLNERIEFHLHSITERNKKSEEASMAMTVAMTAMTSSSELGELISFVSESQKANSLADMGNMIIKVCSDFGLKASVYLNSLKPEYFGCEKGGLESVLLERSIDVTDRIINRGIHTIVKSDNLAILIKNMPIEDENKYGRFKDHLAVLVSIADGRLLTLNAKYESDQQRKLILARVTQHTESKIVELNKKISEYDKKSRHLMLDMVTVLEAELFSMGLDDDQEEKLMKLVYSTSDELEKSKEFTKKLQDELGSILDGLYEILGSLD